MRTERLFHCGERGRWNRPAFTLVELSLGLIVSAMIASALAAFTLAVANCWQRSAGAQTSAAKLNQLNARLTNYVQNARRLGYWRAGGSGSSAGMIFWQQDTNGDHAMQFSELAVLEFDPSTKSISLYVPTPAVDSTWSLADLRDPGSIDRLTQGVSPVPVIRDVSNVQLYIEQPDDSSPLSPLVKWSVQVDQPDGESTVESASVSLRTPATMP